MNAPGNSQTVTASAAELNARAAAWLRRRHLSDWNNDDEIALNIWLDEAPANRIAYWRLSAGWNRMDRLAALQGVHPKDSRTSLRGEFKIAAAILVAALLTGASYWLMRPRETAYSTALGERKTIELADGSSVELNTDTRITLAGTARARTVRIERGEAFFQIKHDPHRLFVVMVGNNRVIDVGTRFLVRREKGSLEVALLEGRAHFDVLTERTQPRSISMTAGDVVVANAQHTILTKEPVNEISDELSWRRGLLVFKHTTLAQAAAEFNRYNREKIVVPDRATARLTLNGTFKINDVAAFTDAAHAVFGLKVDFRDGEIVISH